jgi:predicted transcriptional regulator
MTILTRQERERLVLELYNQGKTIREIAKEVRMSFRDIGVILNKAVEEKAEGLKEQHEEIQQLSVSSQAYKLFSEGKTPLEVAIALNLRESEATKLYKEYWKLKQLHNLSTVYEELRGDIDPFLRLYKLAKRKGMSVKQVVDALTIANNDLPVLEQRFKRLGNDISTLQSQKCIDERNFISIEESSSINN